MWRGCYDLVVGKIGQGKGKIMIATYTEALELINYLENSEDKMTIAYNISGVRSDHMPDVYDADCARIAIDVLNTTADMLGRSINFTICRVDG